MPELNVYELAQGVWAIDDGEVRSYLLHGTERALLLDTGAAGGVAAEVKKIFAGPVIAVNSHAHEDHMAGNGDFGILYAHPRAMESMADACRIRPVREGDRFQLGDMELEVLECPGHTAGDIALLDWERRLLFSGDLLQSRPAVLDGPESDIHRYRESLEKILALGMEDLRLFPSHGETPLDMDHVRDMLACVEAYLSGANRKTEPFHVILPGVDVWTRRFRHGRAEILVSPEE